MRTLLVFATLCAPIYAQSTWYVDASAPAPGSGTLANPYASIQYAIDRPTTLSGDTLRVRPGTYFENVIFNGKSLELASTDGPAVTTIDGGALDSCVRIVNGEGPATVLEGFTLTNGNGFEGGGLRTYTCSPSIRNCVVRANTAQTHGGGMFLGFGSPIVQRCVVTDNSVPGPNGGGGGLYAMYAPNLVVDHCTFYGNSAALGASIKLDFGGGAQVSSTILWSTPGNAIDITVSMPLFTYCDVEGGLTGLGNFDADPLFWNAALRDFHLQSGSPCIDTGDPNAPLDPDGTRSDIGAFPFDPAYPHATAYCTAGTSTHGCAPSISASASPSASLANPCAITITAVEGQKAGLVFYGTDNSNFVPLPWGAGSSWMCVKSPVQRTSLQITGGTASLCDGLLQLDWNAYQLAHPTSLGQPWSAGASVFVQGWYRDPPSAKATNLSNALQLTYQP